MKVLIINAHPPKTGIGKYVIGLANRLASLNHGIDVTLLMLYNYSGPIGAHVKTVYMSRLGYSPITNILHYLTLSHRLPKRFDVYHFAVQTLGYFTKTVHPSVITIHDTIPLEMKMKSLYNSFLTVPYSYFIHESVKDSKFADYAICPSNWCKQRVTRLIGIPAHKIAVVYEGIDHSVFYPRKREAARRALGLPHNIPILINVSNEDYRKNVISLILALKVVKKHLPKVRLIRVGRKTKEVYKLIKELDLEQNVIYVNEISEKDLAYYYSASDVFVTLSIYNGFTVPPIESMACGCPVLAGESSVYPEIIADAGILVNPHNYEQIAQGILKFFDESEKRYGMILKGIERAKVFNWNTAAMQTADVYLRCL